jgi:hypothetical protein
LVRKRVLFIDAAIAITIGRPQIRGNPPLLVLDAPE